MSNIFSDVLIYGVRRKCRLRSIRRRIISSLKNELVEMDPKRLLTKYVRNCFEYNKNVDFYAFFAYPHRLSSFAFLTFTRLEVILQ